MYLPESEWPCDRSDSAGITAAKQRKYPNATEASGTTIVQNRKRRRKIWRILIEKKSIKLKRKLTRCFCYCKRKRKRKSAFVTHVGTQVNMLEDEISKLKQENHVNSTDEIAAEFRETANRKAREFLNPARYLLRLPLQEQRRLSAGILPKGCLGQGIIDCIYIINERIKTIWHTIKYKSYGRLRHGRY